MLNFIIPNSLLQLAHVAVWSAYCLIFSTTFIYLVIILTIILLMIII